MAGRYDSPRPVSSANLLLRPRDHVPRGYARERGREGGLEPSHHCRAPLDSRVLHATPNEYRGTIRGQAYRDVVSWLLSLLVKKDVYVYVYREWSITCVKPRLLQREQYRFGKKRKVARKYVYLARDDFSLLVHNFRACVSPTFPTGSFVDIYLLALHDHSLLRLCKSILKTAEGGVARRVY